MALSKVNLILLMRAWGGIVPMKARVAFIEC